MPESGNIKWTASIPSKGTIIYDICNKTYKNLKLRINSNNKQSLKNPKIWHPIYFYISPLSPWKKLRYSLDEKGGVDQPTHQPRWSTGVVHQPSVLLGWRTPNSTQFINHQILKVDERLTAHSWWTIWIRESTNSSWKRVCGLLKRGCWWTLWISMSTNSLWKRVHGLVKSRCWWTIWIWESTNSS